MRALGRQLTAQQKLIVEYWADGPASELPPGHWSLFAQHVSKRDAHGIDQDVKMFFAMQNASFDAGIVAWHLKRKYDGGQSVVVSGTRLNGSVQLEDNSGPLWLQNLRLDGNIQIVNNRGPASLNGNMANGNLQCAGNQPAPTRTGNIAASKQGQCAGL